MIADARMLSALPDSVDDRAGTLVEPLAVGVRAVAVSELAPDESAVVLGGGPIGLLTALVLRAQGHERFVLVSRNAQRAHLAERLGLPVVTPDQVTERLGGAPAVVFECAGTPAAARRAVDLVGPLGRVLLVGMSLQPLDLAAAPVILKEVVLRGVITYRRGEVSSTRSSCSRPVRSRSTS